MASVETDENGIPVNKTKVSLKAPTKQAPTGSRANTARDSYGVFPDQSAVPSERWKKGE